MVVYYAAWPIVTARDMIGCEARVREKKSERKKTESN